MEIPSDGSGQRLRWWTTETATPAETHSTDLVAPVQAAPQEAAVGAETDLWDELEAEAVRRAASASDTVLIEGDKQAWVAKRIKRVWTMLGIFSLIYLGLGLFTHHHVFLGLSFIFIFEALILSRILKRSAGTGKTYISISSMGISLDMGMYQLGPVFWDEIVSVEPTRLFGIQYLKVRLKQPRQTLARALQMKNSSMQKLNVWLLQWFPLEIMTDGIPISAKEIVVQIAKFRPTLVPAKKQK